VKELTFQMAGTYRHPPGTTSGRCQSEIVGCD